MVEYLKIDQISFRDCIGIHAQLPENLLDLVFAGPPDNLRLTQELWHLNQIR